MASELLQDFKNCKGLWAKGAVTDGGWIETISGRTFHGIVQRCRVGGSRQKVNPRYVGCTNSFNTLEVFTDWAVNQVGYNKGFDLDKDILIRGNKNYSEDTCVFVPQEINSLLISSNSVRGEWPVGVCYSKQNSKFKATYTRNGKTVYLGYFNSPEAAFQAYKTAKEAFIKQQATKWRSQIDPRAYEALMNYEVEITD